MGEIYIAVVGAGALATRRIYPYLGAAGACIAGVCDLDLEKARTNARRFGGKPYRDMDRMLDETCPDGVIICVGPGAHPTLAERAIERGIPVYTEKPPAATSKEAHALACKAREAGVPCTTAFKKRYTEAANRARAWLESFPEEDRLALSIDYASGPYPNDAPERSFLLDFGLHIIDLAPYLFGEVTEVFAFAKGPRAYAVSMRFGHGGVGTLSLNDGRSFTAPTEEIELTAAGGHFMTIHNSSIWRITADGRPVEWREPPTFTSAGDSGRDTGHLSELEDFVAAIREGRTTRSNIAESYRSMVLYEAIAESARSGVPIKPEYLPIIP